MPRVEIGIIHMPGAIGHPWEVDINRQMHARYTSEIETWSAAIRLLHDADNSLPGLGPDDLELRIKDDKGAVVEPDAGWHGNAAPAQSSGGWRSVVYGSGSGVSNESKTFNAGRGDADKRVDELERRLQKLREAHRVTVDTLNKAEDAVKALESERDTMAAAHDASQKAIMAEFANYRKRADGQVAEAREDGKARAVRELLPVADNLTRALEHADNAEQFSMGVLMIHSQLETAFKLLGAEKMDSMGKLFDPNIQQAISMMDTADESLDGCVVAVMQEGWLWKGQVMRPALVSVGKYSVPTPVEEIKTEVENDAAAV